MRQAIAIDLGGTKISWAIVNESYEFQQRLQVPTPATTEAVIDELGHIVDEAVASVPDPAGVGIGVAGLVDHGRGLIVAAPNLPLAGEPIIERLHARWGFECQIDNDANLAVLGELVAGAGRGRRDFIGLTVGTGIGGGIIIDGRLWRGHKGAAGEFGHMIVDPRGPVCGCGNHGCLETKASGTAIERLAKESVAGKPGSALAKSVGGDAELMTGLIVAKEARTGNDEALAVLAEAGRWLGIGIGNLINIFDPEIVVVGGGVAGSLDLVMDHIENRVRQVVIDPRGQETPISLSRLENSAGLLGAAALILG